MSKLVKCGSCGREVAASAKACMNCGAAPPKDRTRLWLLLGALALLALMTSSAGSGRSKSSSSSSGGGSWGEPSLSEKRAAWVERGKDAIRERLKDADSAKFRGTFYSNSGGYHVACGEVNAKNSFGAYGGYQRFVSGGERKLAFLENEVEDFDRVWRKLCRR